MDVIEKSEDAKNVSQKCIKCHESSFIIAQCLIINYYVNIAFPNYQALMSMGAYL